MGKIAISVQNDKEGLQAVMDGRFGRAEAFLVVDPESGEVLQTVENPHLNSSHGAGTAVANMMKSMEVDAVVSGRFGPKAFDALRALGIETWMAPPDITAQRALELFREGSLERMELQIIR